MPASIPGGVTGLFIDIFLLTVHGPGVDSVPSEKGGQCMRLKASPPSCAECHEIWELKPPGTTGPVTGLLYLLLYFVTIDSKCNVYPLLS